MLVFICFAMVMAILMICCDRQMAISQFAAKHYRTSGTVWVQDVIGMFG
jgi:hypothetical protein